LRAVLYNGAVTTNKPILVGCRRATDEPSSIPTTRRGAASQRKHKRRAAATMYVLAFCCSHLSPAQERSSVVHAPRAVAWNGRGDPWYERKETSRPQAPCCVRVCSITTARSFQPALIFRVFILELVVTILPVHSIDPWSFSLVPSSALVWLLGSPRRGLPACTASWRTWAA